MKWNKLLAALLFSSLCVLPVRAGTIDAGIVSACGAQSLTAGNSHNVYMDTTGNLCSSATGGGGGGGAVTIADGADVTLGAKADAAWSGSGSGSLISIMKKVEALLASGVTVTGTVTANLGATDTANLATIATNSGTQATAANQTTGNTSAATTATNTGTIAGAVTSSVMQSNLKQVNGVTTLTGAGAVGTGSERVAVGQDTTTIAGSAPGTAGTPSANVVTIQGAASGGTAIPVIPSTGAFVQGTQSVTGTASTQLIALVSSQHIYAITWGCQNSSATAVTVAAQDGNGGTTLDTLEVPAGGGNNKSGGWPLFRTTAGNALYFQASASATTIYCTASGFSSAN